MSQSKCMIQGCLRSAAKRGVCLVCYSRAKKKVEAGEATWEQLIELGLVESDDGDPFEEAFKRANPK